MWECKTTNILQSMQKEKWKERLPDNYYIQLLHGLLIMEADFAVLKARLKYEFGGEIYVQVKHYHLERAEVEEDIKILEESLDMMKQARCIAEEIARKKVMI